MKACFIDSVCYNFDYNFFCLGFIIVYIIRLFKKMSTIYKTKKNFFFNNCYIGINCLALRQFFLTTQ